MHKDFLLFFILVVAVAASLMFSMFGENVLFNRSGVKRIDKLAMPSVVGSPDLYSTVRVFCLVTTIPATVKDKAVAVWNTWGKRCNKVLFVTTEKTDLVPAVVLPVREGREHLTEKSLAAFNYSYHHHLDEFDWFLKADDDTFVIMENMRHFLANFSSSDPSFYGFHFKMYVKQGYYSGGAGYVLSREAVRRLIENGFKRNRCRYNQGIEDLEVAACLELVGVKTGDSRDSAGRERFHPFSIMDHLDGNFPDWFIEYAKHAPRKGVGCCSDVSISFHYLSPQDMNLIHFLIYHVRVVGEERKLAEMNHISSDRRRRNSTN